MPCTHTPAYVCPDTSKMPTKTPMLRRSSSSSVQPLNADVTLLQSRRESKTVALLSTFATLFMTMVGSGLLSVPYLFMLLPTPMVVTCLVVVGAAMTFTASLLVDMYQATKLTSTRDIAQAAYGSWFSTAMSVTTIFALIGAGTGSIQIFLDIGPSMLALVGLPTSPTLAMVFLFVLTVPLAMSKSISTLQFTSYIGIAASIYLIAAVVLHPSHASASASPFPIESTTTTAPVWRAVHVVSVFNFGFVNHLNVLQLLESLERAFMNRAVVLLPTTYGSAASIYKCQTRSHRRMYMILALVGSFVMFLYGLFGITSRQVYGVNTQGNILLNFQEDPIMVVPKLAVFITVLLSFPLLFHPLVHLTEQVVWGGEASTPIRAFDASVLLGCLILFATTIPGIQGTFSLTGGSCVTLICFVFPVVSFLKLCPEASKTRRVVAAAIGVVSSIVGVAATFVVVSGMTF